MSRKHWLQLCGVAFMRRCLMDLHRKDGYADPEGRTERWFADDRVTDPVRLNCPPIEAERTVEAMQRPFPRPSLVAWP